MNVGGMSARPRPLMAGMNRPSPYDRSERMGMGMGGGGGGMRQGMRGMAGMGGRNLKGNILSVVKFSDKRIMLYPFLL